MRTCLVDTHFPEGGSTVMNAIMTRDGRPEQDVMLWSINVDHFSYSFDIVLMLALP